MKYFKDVHVVLEETDFYDEGEGIKVTLDTSDSEKVDYDIGIDAVSEGGYSGYYCKMSLKDFIYKINDMIPYEWLDDIKEGKENDQIKKKRIMKELITF